MPMSFFISIMFFGGEKVNDPITNYCEQFIW